MPKNPLHFFASLNTDVEDFIHTKAIQFVKQKITISYLVFAGLDNLRYLVGYYTLTNKFVCVNNTSLSKTMQKKISKFSQYDPASDRFMVSINWMIIINHLLKMVILMMK